MTDQPSPDRRADTQSEVEEVKNDLKRMDRPDRAIPLPDQVGDDQDDDGVGPVTGIVP